jgi:hypothetical protein
MKAKSLSATLYTTNSTCNALESNPSLRGKKTAIKQRKLEEKKKNVVENKQRMEWKKRKKVFGEMEKDKNKNLEY